MSATQAIVSRTRFTNFQRMLQVNAAAAGDVPTPVVSLTAPVGMVEVNEYVSAEMLFFGAGTDAETCTFTLYGIRLLGASQDRTDNKFGLAIFVPFVLGTGSFTLSSGIPGLATGYLDSTQLVADLATWVPNAAFVTNYMDPLVGNSPVLYAPNDNARPALLAFPDLLNFHGLVMDIVAGTADDGNALISLWT